MDAIHSDRLEHISVLFITFPSLFNPCKAKLILEGSQTYPRSTQHCSKMQQRPWADLSLSDQRKDVTLPQVGHPGNYDGPYLRTGFAVAAVATCSDAIPSSQPIWDHLGEKKNGCQQRQCLNGLPPRPPAALDNSSKV